jgi:hydrogenase maturation protease
MTPPLLVFGWGNPSRGDDALGPLFIDCLRTALAQGGDKRVEFLDDFQLQVEHALDLAERQQVLFVDASLNCTSPFAVTALRATRDESFSSHAMSPQSVMQVFRDLYKAEPPPCTLLAVRGNCFELGAPPSPVALDNLAQAVAWGMRWLTTEGVSD